MARSSLSPRKRKKPWLLPLLAAVVFGATLVAQTGTPDIQVLDNTTELSPTSTVDFGTTPVGMAKSKTFTVKNTGTDNLLVSEAISVPVGFTLMASFPGVFNATLPTNVPAFTIKPNATATFTVALNSAKAGNFSGSVGFRTNVTGKNPFVFKVKGKVLPPPSVCYVDDKDADFTFTSGWTQDYSNAGTSGAVPFQGSLTRAPAGTGTETATWSFSGLEPGQYRVAATWVGYSDAATSAPFTVCDGTTALGTVTVDQTADASGFGDGNSAWQELGIFTITGSTLAVKLSDKADGTVSADAVRIERVGYPGQIIDDAGSAFSTPTGTWTAGYTEAGVKDFQGSVTFAEATTTPGTPTATAQWTFTVTPGTYRVMTGFGVHANAASNAPFCVFDDTTNLTPNPVLVNQQVTPTDLSEPAVGWTDLGFFTVASQTLTVQLSNDGDGRVFADAVRIERVNTPTTPSTADSLRFLEQATWGPTSASLLEVQGAGFTAWLDNQFTVPATSYPTLPLYNNNDNVTNNNTTSCYGDPTVAGNPARSACLRDHYTMYPLQNQLFTNALYGDDQLRQRVAWALHKIWVISGVELRQPAWVAPYLQILSNNAFGNYRTLMYQVTLNPGMGKYLSMAGSSKAHPNENYPREIMQLFTIGLNELNPDGTTKNDSNNVPIPTYDQTLVDNMTRVFTGWNFAPAPASGIPNYIDPMRLNGAATENPVNHDFTKKTLLRGFVQPARTSSVTNAYLDLNEALDNIYNHPGLPPFICKQLIQQLVTSNPSPAYVARVADTFDRNRTSTTQLREVIQAILLDPEARGDRKTASNYGHLKEPVLYIANMMRLYGAKSDDRTKNSDGYLNPYAVNMGQDAFRPPSVFSYFSPGKVAVGGNPPVLGPEFQIQTTATALARVNFVNQSFAPNSTRTIDVVRAHGTTPNGTDTSGNPIVATGPNGTAVDISSLLGFATDPSALADELNQGMLHGTMTAEMKSSIVTAVTAVTLSNPPTDAQKRKRVRTAVYLVASSSQYQVQR
jgi:uncharacterized protein (DUF1800 family)